MLRSRTLALVPVVLGLSLAACASEADVTDSGDSAQTTAAVVDPARLFDEGFQVVTRPECASGSKDSSCSFAFLDDSGRRSDPNGGVRWASAPFDLSFGLQLQDKITIGACAGGANDCYTIYQWPATIPTRSYDAIADQMREYSKLVGTLLKREAKGPGEEAWASYLRSQQYTAVRRAAPRGGREMCGAVIKSFVDTLVPSGSDFLQYGNCGEGGHIGACLAYKAGFEENQIRLCGSDHDHFFAMVEAETPAQKWCVLDRWSIINSDNYACDVDWDPDTRHVTYKGENVQQKWFEDVTCVTMKEYMENGASLR